MTIEGLQADAAMARIKAIEAIRAKCIEANPEIVERDALWCPKHGFLSGEAAVDHRRNCAEQIEDRREFRPIRLSDVLLAMKQKESLHGNARIKLHIDGTFWLLDGKIGTRVDAEAQWNLRTDDLEAQSDETIAFISSLLGK